VSVPVVRFTIAGTSDTAAPSLGRPYTVVFDGQCKVCTRVVRALEKWDRNRELEIVASQTPGVQARFPWIPPRAYVDSLQLVGPGGRTWQGAAAIEQLLDVLPKGKRISWIFSIPFMRRLADRVYRWFARNRYKLGCGDHCQLRSLDVEYGDEEDSRSQR
jgi:predicted DCC family thiol-disulfide oxidoreductase YuxK